MLLTPGPTPVPEFARKAMSDITIHHRTPEFEAIFEKTRTLWNARSFNVSFKWNRGDGSLYYKLNKTKSSYN